MSMKYIFSGILYASGVLAFYFAIRLLCSEKRKYRENRMISVFGIALAYSVHCSESIAISMLMHFCNNGFSVLTIAFPVVVSKICPFLIEENPGMGTYMGMTAAAVICLGIGVKLLHKKK